MKEKCEPLMCRLFLRIEKKIEEQSMPPTPKKGEPLKPLKLIPHSDRIFLNCSARDGVNCTNPKRKKEG